MKKIRVIGASMLAIVVLSFCVGNAFGQPASATLTMKNNSPFVCALYVSGEYKCTAQPNEACVTQVTPLRDHVLSARADGEEVTSQHYTFEEGEVRIWTLKFKPNK